MSLVGIWYAVTLTPYSIPDTPILLFPDLLADPKRQ